MHSHVCLARKLKFIKNLQSMVTQQTIPKVTEDPLQMFIQHLATKITQRTAKWLHSNNTNGCRAVRTMLQRNLAVSGIVNKYMFTHKHNVCSNLAESDIVNKFVFTHKHYVCSDLTISGIVTKFKFTWKHIVCSGTGAFGYV